MNWKERRHKRLRKRAKRRESFIYHDIRYAYKGRWKKAFVFLSILERSIHERT